MEGENTLPLLSTFSGPGRKWRKRQSLSPGGDLKDNCQSEGACGEGVLGTSGCSDIVVDRGVDTRHPITEGAHCRN